MIEGHKEAAAKSEKANWYHTRQICWVVLQGYVDPKKAHKNIDDWWSLEERPKSRKMSQKTLAKKVAEVQARLNKTNNG